MIVFFLQVHVVLIFVSWLPQLPHSTVIVADAKMSLIRSLSLIVFMFNHLKRREGRFLNGVWATQSEPSLEPGIKGSASVLLLARCCELNTEAVFPVKRGRFPPLYGFTESPLRI